MVIKLCTIVKSKKVLASDSSSGAESSDDSSNTSDESSSSETEDSESERANKLSALEAQVSHLGTMVKSFILILSL